MPTTSSIDAPGPAAGDARRRWGRPRPIVVAAALLVTLLAAGGIYGVLGGFDNNVTKRLPGGGTKVVRVALVDALVGFDVTPDTVVVDRGTRLVLDVVNEAEGPHDLAVIGGRHTRTLRSGDSQRLDLGQVSGNLDAVCTLPDHEFAGMTLDVRVVDRRDTAGATTG